MGQSCCIAQEKGAATPLSATPARRRRSGRTPRRTPAGTPFDRAVQLATPTPRRKDRQQVHGDLTHVSWSSWSEGSAWSPAWSDDAADASAEEVPPAEAPGGDDAAARRIAELEAALAAAADRIARVEEALGEAIPRDVPAALGREALPRVPLCPLAGKENLPPPGKPRRAGRGEKARARHG